MNKEKINIEEKQKFGGNMKKNTRPDFCMNHKPMYKKLGYLAHVAWMEKQIKEGSKQKKCPTCKRWLFPCEY